MPCPYDLYRAQETNEFAVALFGRQQYKGEHACKVLPLTLWISQQADAFVLKIHVAISISVSDFDNM